MNANLKGPAKLYHTQRADSPWVVIYRDPARREKCGRAKRIVKWFADHGAAVKHRAHLNASLLTEGTAGVTFDANVRGDALAARRHLDANGQMETSLLTLAQRHTAVVTVNGAAQLPIGPQIEAFLHEKTHVDGAERETRKNLEARLWLWIELAKITTVGDISRQSVEPLRTRAVHPQTRRNDMSVASAFCTWLLDKGRLDHHPVKGLKRPKVPQRKKLTHTPAEVLAMLRAARKYLKGKWLGSLAVLYWTGARPSELAETRFTYGRPAVARIEGGKLQGRANRTLPLMPAAVAWLKQAGQPAQVAPLPRYVRTKLAKMAGVKWHPDVARHTYITHRLLLVESDAQVAREAGTSEAMIHRHYRNPSVTKADARRWEELRP